MNKFLLFVGGLIALFVLLANLGPMILLAVSAYLLYVIFKQFVKSESTVGKIMWVIVGLIVLSIGVANIYALLGVVALYVLYVIYKKWKEDKEVTFDKPVNDDPFTNFERQWAELNK
ncbi:flagellar basal body rod protein [Alteribacter populi]|uniref:lmo0954 family membrane protein n=1 Tax=Alteribacter populi TaxID=2011011 RepID=UPI000BBB2646|nr:flagellar basal body rod protein [Alteribacter populi]